MSKSNFYFFLIAVLLLFSLNLFLILKDDDYSTGKVSLYSRDGTLIKEYSGKIEHIRRYNGFKFTVDGRHVITQGIIAIFEEGDAAAK